MKKQNTLFKLALALCLLPQAFSALNAGAPLKMNFQGRLDESGQPAEGSKTFVFKIYDALSAGTLVWTSQSQAVTVAQGAFSTVLSTGATVDLSTSVFAGARYVEITVDGVPLSPRQEMVSAPYALVAQALAPDAVLPPASIAAGSINDSHVVLTTAAITSGTFGDDRVLITTGAFTGGFNGNDQLVQLDGTARLPAVDGSLLTNLPVPSGAVARAGDTMSGQLTLAGSTLTVTGNAFSVGGSSLVVAGGKVGIGTVSPNYTLDAQGGSVNASAGLCIAGDCKSSWSSAGDNLGSHTAGQALNMAGNFIHNASSLTVTGGAFSVGGSTFVVSGGNVGIGLQSPGTRFSVNGPMSLAVTAISADYTVTENDSTMLIDPAANPTISLPSTSGIAGRIYVFRQLGTAGATVIESFPPQTIEGGTDITLNTCGVSGDELVTIQTDGTNWYVISYSCYPA